MPCVETVSQITHCLQYTNFYTLFAIYKFFTHCLQYTNFYTLFAIFTHCLQYTNFYTLSDIIYKFLHIVSHCLKYTNFTLCLKYTNFALCLQCTTLPACSLTCRSLNELKEKIQGCNHNAEVLYYTSITWYKKNSEFSL